MLVCSNRRLLDIYVYWYVCISTYIYICIYMYISYMCIYGLFVFKQALAHSSDDGYIYLGPCSWALQHWRIRYSVSRRVWWGVSYLTPGLPWHDPCCAPCALYCVLLSSLLMLFDMSGCRATRITSDVVSELCALWSAVTFLCYYRSESAP